MLVHTQSDSVASRALPPSEREYVYPSTPLQPPDYGIFLSSFPSFTSINVNPNEGFPPKGRTLFAEATPCKVNVKDGPAHFKPS
ncbi:hypothetical protein Hypma_006433 [Hypsizygus marmoreus]|uniref:Uncharacterized protein n=1 Tax=Hypsizygus marmoreus TaxID=39966 RepID=A0A369JWR9_HYPMA|nr:hypothetical protein Hypma_006433 [Hypsizygus marmoreus]